MIMADPFATARRTVGAASAVSPRLGGRVALGAFFATGRRMPVRADDSETHLRAQRGTVVVRGHDLATYRWGTGDRTVLLLHGWRGRASQFAPLVRELVAERFHVVAFDAPAHGDSPGRSTDIRDWLAATEQLQARFGRFQAIVGHSFGGLAALTAARSGVTTSAVATIAGAGTPAAFLAEFSGAMRLGERTRERFEAGFRRQLGEDAASLVRRYDAAADPLPVGIDLLLAHDDTDRQLSPTWSLALAEAHGDRARLVRTTGFGHVRILSADAVLDAVVGLAAGGLGGVDRALGGRAATAPADAPRTVPSASGTIGA
jgi:pimeloyl-ACP methyl ester carboxylesterase